MQKVLIPNPESRHPPQAQVEAGARYGAVHGYLLVNDMVIDGREEIVAPRDPVVELEELRALLSAQIQVPRLAKVLEP